MNRSNKKIVVYLVIVIIAVFTVSIQQLSGMRFNKKPLPGNECLGIRYVEIKGNIRVVLNSYERLKNNVNELKDIDLENVDLIKSNDTLKILYKGIPKYSPKKTMTNGNELSFSINNIKGVFASNGAVANVVCISSDTIKVTASDSSTINLYSYNPISRAEVNLSGRSMVWISYINMYTLVEQIKSGIKVTVPETNINMRDNAHLIINLPKSKITGNLENKSYIELNEVIDKGYDCSGLAVKDSSSILYKLSVFYKKSIVNRGKNE